MNAVPKRRSLAGTMVRPGRGDVYAEVWGVGRQPDTQRQRVYAWQASVLDAHMLEDDPLIGSFIDTARGRAVARAPADEYLALLWRTYVTEFAPFFTGVPRLVIGWRVCVRISHLRRGRHRAHASSIQHAIYCQLDMLSREHLLHEVSHLFSWREGGHGPQFCRVLLTLWHREFGIDPASALAAAAAHGVEVAP
jgi:hypothetical protein